MIETGGEPPWHSGNLFDIVSTVSDSGAHFFMGGEMYFRLLDQLTINVIVARTIRDEDWTAYLDGSFAISKRLGRVANVSLTCSVHAYPNARQRQMASDFMANQYGRTMDRVAIITENTVVRGAMTAMSWLVPKMTMHAFGPNDVSQALHWLREVSIFDEATALSAWTEAQAKLSFSRASLRPPG